MSIEPARIIRSRHRNNLFSLTVNQYPTDTAIVMKMLAPVVNTYKIPQTYPILKKHLPKVLKSKCFNQHNYPFHIEVRKTEIGHLFEHILLEYLCEQKTREGFKNPVYNGTTEWDWEKDEKGTFKIRVDVGHSSKTTFKRALSKSIRLTNNIINKSV